MNTVYLLSMVDEEDISSTVFTTKKKALDFMIRMHPEYSKIAEDVKEDIEFWRKVTGEGILLERVQVQQ